MTKKGLTRRNFIKSSSVLAISSVLTPTINLSKLRSETNFKSSLVPGSIGLKTDANTLIFQAYSYNFTAIAPLIPELVSFSSNQIETYLNKMDDHNLVFDTAGLPVQFRSDEKTFLKDYEELKINLPKLSTLKVPGFVTWIMPTNKKYNYFENFNIHKSRLKKVAMLLNDYNMRLGLEYVGPKTLMSRDKFPFIHTISELKTLIDAIDEKSIGYLLDSFHMFCSEDTVDDYIFLESNDIVSVQINDAVLGRTVSEQLDLERNLPGVTGLINLKGFLKMLKSKGYDGCISVEPFNKNLNDMEENDKLKTVYDSIQNTFKTISN
tara:strand:- start:2254 stop:3219 length:966 start_codon:yes stop_codon:yes gene_type:complete